MLNVKEFKDTVYDAKISATIDVKNMTLLAKEHPSKKNSTTLIKAENNKQVIEMCYQMLDDLFEDEYTQ